MEIHIGPAVTEYELTVPPATKVSRILNIDKEIALALAAKDVIIQAPIPGKVLLVLKYLIQPFRV